MGQRHKLRRRKAGIFQKIRIRELRKRESKRDADELKGHNKHRALTMLAEGKPITVIERKLKVRRDSIWAWWRRICKELHIEGLSVQDSLKAAKAQGWNPAR